MVLLQWQRISSGLGLDQGLSSGALSRPQVPGANDDGKGAAPATPKPEERVSAMVGGDILAISSGREPDPPPAPAATPSVPERRGRGAAWGLNLLQDLHRRPKRPPGRLRMEPKWRPRQLRRRRRSRRCSADGIPTVRISHPPPHAVQRVAVVERGGRGRIISRNSPPADDEQR